MAVIEAKRFISYRNSGVLDNLAIYLFFLVKMQVLPKAAALPRLVKSWQTVRVRYRFADFFWKKC